MTFRDSLYRALRFKLLGFALVAAFLLPFEVFGATPPVPAPAAHEPFEVTALAATMGCWSGAAPADMAGRMPGAMVTTQGVYVTDAERVATALDRGLRGLDTEAYAFCRGGAR